MHTCDIVYFLREGENEELRYSLRSVMKNFPHRDIWFYGGKPDWLVTDKFVPVNQWRNKWGNVQMMVKMACDNPDISEDFFIFNDDFFIMKSFKTYKNRYDGELFRRIFILEKRHGFMGSDYIIRLRKMANALLEWNPKCQILNYATHTPFLVNKTLMKQTIEQFPDIVSYRCLYGNVNKIGGTDCPDVKYDKKDSKTINAPIISTSDRAFKHNNIGRLIRDKFQDKTIYERD